MNSETTPGVGGKEPKESAVEIEPQEFKDIATAMIQINGLSPFNLKRRPLALQTAFLILPGPRDHEYREKEGIRLYRSWREQNIVKYLMVSGTNEEPSLSYDTMQQLTEGISSSDIFFEQKARHTKDQMEWASDTLHNRLPHVNHVILSTAAYHLPRGFLTLLQTIKDREQQLMLSTAPVYDRYDPSRDFTGFAQTGSTGILGEIERIRDYQKTGDVATLETYLHYLKWRLSL
ncbi:YdcF family protein [Candidatus Microgenomates bacterium]|nr:YdcF family protein [Candidatus Microgenomates bacterium]